MSDKIFVVPVWSAMTTAAKETAERTVATAVIRMDFLINVLFFVTFTWISVTIVIAVGVIFSIEYCLVPVQWQMTHPPAVLWM